MFHEDQPERIPGPEIGDYLGLPITDAARLRGDIWDAEILTLPEHQCKPHPADYGPRGPFNFADLEGSGYGHAADHRVAHAWLLAGSRANHLYGWPAASAGVRGAHLAGILDGKVGRRHSHHHHHAPQDRLDPAERHPAQRPGDSYRALDPARRPPDAGQHRERSGVSDRAVHPLDGLRAGSAPADRSVSVRSGDGSAAAERRGAEFSAGDESVPERVCDEARDTGEGCAWAGRKRCIPRQRCARSGESSDPGAELDGRRRNPHPAGPRQRLHAGRRRRKYHRPGGQGRRAGGGHEAGGAGRQTHRGHPEDLRQADPVCHQHQRRCGSDGRERKVADAGRTITGGNVAGFNAGFPRDHGGARKGRRADARSRRAARRLAAWIPTSSTARTCS